MKIKNLQHKNFIRLLKQARIEAGLSQTQVAKAIGRSQSFVSKIESGAFLLEMQDFLKLYELYHKPASFFFKAFETNQVEKPKTLKKKKKRNNSHHK